jgi:hypothetical protein
MASGELPDRLVLRVAFPDGLVLLHQVEALGDLFRTNRTAIRFGGYLSGVDPDGASGGPLLSLPLLPGLKHVNGWWGSRSIVRLPASDFGSSGSSYECYRPPYTIRHGWARIAASLIP